MDQKVKNLLQEAYTSSDVCQEWKDKIKDVYPEVTPKLEVRKWYTDGVDLICITSLEYNINFTGSITQSHYGFRDGNWIEDEGWSNTSKSEKLIPATKEEVKEALLKEARKRGFVKGSSIKGHADEYGLHVSPHSAITLDIDNGDSFFGNNCLQLDAAVVFKDGIWGELNREVISLKEAEKLLNKRIIK